MPCMSRSSALKVRSLGSTSWLAADAAPICELLEGKSNSSPEETPEERLPSSMGLCSPSSMMDSATPGMVVATELKSSPTKAVAFALASKSTNCPKKSLAWSSVLALFRSSQNMVGSLLLSTASALTGTVQEVISSQARGEEGAVRLRETGFKRRCPFLIVRQLDVRGVLYVVGVGVDRLSPFTTGVVIENNILVLLEG